MGNMEWIIGLGALAIGGWCFLAGPCKGWLNNLTNNSNGNGLYNQESYTKAHSPQSIQESWNLIDSYQKGNISLNELSQRSKANANYTRLAI